MIDWSKGVPLKAGEMQLGIYQPSPETVGFWEGVAAGELRIRHCEDCGADLHPRRIVCPECSRTRLSWKRASGGGSVYSFSQVHHATGVFQAAVPYIVGIVRLDEGVFLFTRIVSEDASMALVGSRVSVAFQRLEHGDTLPVFVSAARAD